MTAPVVHSLREQIREHIVEGIVSGRWKPGERIVERRIATELEVSQTPVREALRELESLRLIESAPNKGVRVRNLTRPTWRRAIRCGPAWSRSPRSWRPSGWPRTARRWSRMWPRCTRPTGPATAPRQVRHTVGFHRELVRAAGNSRAAAHLGGRWASRCSRRCRSGGSAPVQQSYAEEHQELVEAFRRRDPRIGGPGEGPRPGLRAARLTQPSAPTLTCGNREFAAPRCPTETAPRADFLVDREFLPINPLIDHRSGSYSRPTGCPPQPVRPVLPRPRAPPNPYR